MFPAAQVSLELQLVFAPRSLSRFRVEFEVIIKQHLQRMLLPDQSPLRGRILALYDLKVEKGRLIPGLFHGQGREPADMHADRPTLDAADTVKTPGAVRRDLQSERRNFGIEDIASSLRRRSDRFKRALGEIESVSRSAPFRLCYFGATGDVTVLHFGVSE